MSTPLHQLDLTDAPPSLRLDAGQVLEISLAQGGHWYGHGFNHDMPYPLETGEIANEAFAVNNIQSPVWMCSLGRVLLVETRAVLSVSLNREGSGYLRISCPDQAVEFRIFSGPSLPAAHTQYLAHVGWPNAVPDASLFGDSFFCTWTQFPRCITQERILAMARQIREAGYPCSKLLIDDRWESCFGELEFSPKDFPDPGAMMAELKTMGFETWLWATPFVNQEARDFDQLGVSGILVPSATRGGAATFRWWGGTAGLVDLSNPKAKQWYRDKIQALLDLGAAGIKIDGGDYKYQPATDTCRWHEDPGASGYSDLLLSFFEDFLPNQCESRAAWLSQNRSILWREGGKDSHWGEDNGLKALLHLGLHLSLLGYDQLIPDMVPGRVQTMNEKDPLPTDELMVRWTECSAFFPFLQFSYFPWNYAQATAEAVAGYARVHKSLQDYLADQAHQRTRPLLRPLWLDHPEVDAFYSIKDQFLLGSDLMAAPILDPGVTRRTIHLPPGNWIDAWDRKPVSGTLTDWPAPCPGIPVFVHERNKALLDDLHTALSKIDRGSTPSGTSTEWEAGLNRDLSVTG
jgi:alpha-glucosidase (family GH31 glycosyl hydrolase)